MSEDGDSLTLLQYVSDFRSHTGLSIAQDNLKFQKSMKDRYKYTTECTFTPADKVLVLLPIPGRPLQTRYFGPYVVEKKNLVISVMLLKHQTGVKVICSAMLKC